MAPLIRPQISINGTKRDLLVEQQVEVIEALRAVLDAMGKATPDGRDYQHRPAELTQAVEAWTERRKMVEGLLAEISAHAESIALEG